MKEPKSGCLFWEDGAEMAVSGLVMLFDFLSYFGHPISQ
jgi:hypothetical protein